ncbi:MAG: threonine ammonia-lyase [Candidatus Hermodarchaeia archaeon]|jgi:threonine dehydratase
MDQSTSLPVTPKMILQAHKRLEGVIVRTPVKPSPHLSTLSGRSVHVKWECLQRTGVFKLRGAYNKIASLPSDTAERGVVTASTGNHALAVAYAAHQRKIPATVVVPHDASPLKMKKCKQYGATILEHGDNYDDAAEYSVKYAENNQLTLVHAYADPLVIAGQGTVGYELLEDFPNTDVVIVPIGGGGLISGISLWIKANNPNIRIIGVQTTATRAFYENYHRRQLFHVPIEPTIADGLAGNTNQLNLDIALEFVDEIVLVEEDGLRDAIRWTLDHEAQTLEPAGVVGIAALLENRVTLSKDAMVAIIASGRNIDPKLLKEIQQS